MIWEKDKAAHRRMREQHPEYFEPWAGLFAQKEKEMKGANAFVTYVPSHSEPGLKHKVTVTKVGHTLAAECDKSTCKGFRYNNKCSHQPIAIERAKKARFQ